jgi:hypothetical protein
MQVLLQNGKAIPVDENTVLEPQVLTRKGLEEMYQGGMNAANKINSFIGIVGIGSMALFCLVPVAIMISTGMSFSDIAPILGVLAVVVVFWLLTHKLSQKSMQKQYNAIANGQFRFLHDTIADMSVHTYRTDHGSRKTYYVKGRKHPDERQMFDAWWTVSKVGDEVYMFEIANAKGKYHPREVFPAKVFTLDSELEAYVDRESVNTGGFEV